MEAIVGIIVIVLLIAFWKYLLGIIVCIVIIYALYKAYQVAEEQQKKEAETRAKEIQHMTQNLRDNVQRIADGMQHPVWDSQQGDKILSTIFSGSASSAILLGDLQHNIEQGEGRRNES